MLVGSVVVVAVVAAVVVVVVVLAPLLQGGFMQPQGHVQVISRMVDHGLNPQEALDAPRFCIRDGTAGGKVCIEEGVPEAVVEQLRRMGHDVEVTQSWDRFVFGRGQIIRFDAATGVRHGFTPRPYDYHFIC